VAKVKAARATLLLLSLAGVSFAQSRTTLVDAPLAVLMSMPEAEIRALQSEFRQVLARHDAVLIPTRSSWNKAVASVGRTDCGLHDACLQQLALASGSVYALFASVERDAAATEVTVTGRVVDRDGRRVRERTLLTRAGIGRASVQAALHQLVFELKLDELPAVLESRPVATLPSAPLLLPASSAEPPPARVAAWVTMGAAVSAAATSLAFGLTAASQLSALPPDGRLTSEDQARLQLEGNRSASIALGTGLGAGALLATSVGLFLVSGPVTISAAPTRDGGGVFASGRF
jgi:hypothetical protein